MLIKDENIICPNCLNVAYRVKQNIYDREPLKAEYFLYPDDQVVGDRSTLQCVFCKTLFSTIMSDTKMLWPIDTRGMKKFILALYMTVGPISEDVIIQGISLKGKDVKVLWGYASREMGTTTIKENATIWYFRDKEEAAKFLKLNETMYGTYFKSFMDITPNSIKFIEALSE